MKKLKVYIISGTLGAGKTTVSRLLAKQLKDAALIRADLFLDDMLVNPQNPAWEARLAFVWSNVIFTAKNALDLNLDVIIDGVVEQEFPLLQEAFENYDLYYCILVADEAILTKRLEARGQTEMLERSIKVLKQFRAEPEKQEYLIDTSHLAPTQVLRCITDLLPALPV